MDSALWVRTGGSRGDFIKKETFHLRLHDRILPGREEKGCLSHELTLTPPLLLECYFYLPSQTLNVLR